jgi:hypothetical protein
MSTAALRALEESHASLRHALMAGDAAAIADAAARVGETTARIGDDDWTSESREQMVERITRLRAELAQSRGMLNILGDNVSCRQTVIAALRGDGAATPSHC